MSQVATPSGIDQDYNFIHSIEHQVERSEKRIVEDRGLVNKEELRLARNGPDRRRDHGRHRQHGPPGETPIERLLEVMKIRVMRAPKGMSRNVENNTNWSKHQKCINWQVEWIHEDRGRLLGKAMGNKPLGDAYAEVLEGDQRRKLTDHERKPHKKRKAGQVRQRSAKKVKLDTQHILDRTTIRRIQNPETGAWDIPELDTAREESPAPEEPSVSSTLNFYLYRPNTPSSFPKILITLDASKPLMDLLRKRELLEFPTIYIFRLGTTPPSEEFMLEKDFLIATRQAPEEEEEEEDDSETDDFSSSGEDSDTSTSGSDSSETESRGEAEEEDEHMKEG